MSSEHFGRLAGDRVDLDANFFPFPGRLHLFVVALDARHDPDVQELKKNRQVHISVEREPVANVDGATKRVPPKSLTVEETYPDQIKPNLTTLYRAMGSMPYTGGRLSGPLLALF